MATKKIFSSEEEADAYYNYFVVNINAQDRAEISEFHTRHQAHESEHYSHIDSASIFTRKQFIKFKENNPKYFEAQ